MWQPPQGYSQGAKGEKLKLSISAATTGFERQTGRKNCLAFKCGKSPVSRMCQKVVPREHKGQGTPSHPSLPQEAQQQEPESFCASCTAVSVCMLTFPSTMRSRPITHVWSSGSQESRSSWSSRTSLSLRLVCKQANCKRLIYYRVPCPRESLFFVPF